MPRDVSLKIRLSDGSPEVSLKGTLPDEDVASLEAFIRYTDELDAVRLVKSGFQFSYRVQMDETKTVFSAQHPQEDEVMAVLHRLRPLVLSKEHASFDRVSGILGRTFKDARFHSVLKQIRVTYDCAEPDSPRFISNDVALNSRELLFVWLNAHEYHRDLDKQASLEKILGHAPDVFVRQALLMAINGLILGIRALAGLAETVLGRRNTFSAHVQKAGEIVPPP
jgi:hypothetical protein